MAIHLTNENIWFDQVRKGSVLNIQILRLTFYKIHKQLLHIKRQNGICNSLTAILRSCMFQYKFMDAERDYYSKLAQRLTGGDAPVAASGRAKSPLIEQISQARYDP